MQKEMPKTYDPHMEDEINRRWIERGYFTAKADKNKKPFTIVIPPPNITGQLHMGHALNNTIQDILIRAKRMQGYAALWVPGYDHAAIATEVRVMKELAKEGVTKESLGREGFLEKVWQWKEKYGGTIVGQLKRMGFSCDWSRERFTMDEGLSDAVLEVFVRLYGEGKIYRGKKLVNWCTKCQTTISDAEVEHEESFNWMYSFKYPVKGGGEFITFATTRPETMLGDTAVAVNPSDGRYAHLVGKTVTVPFVDRDIPVIADAYVEAEFGTGVVKITPAHDHNDYAVGERHCLPMINIMTDDGMLNENTGPYEGMEIYAAREKIIADMEAAGLYAGKESIKNAVGTHDRCGTTVEPLLKLQWFVKMEELAKPALDAYKSGELRFNRERFGRIYSHWLENIRDWCISRQLWWGHRIPAYYCECGFVTVSKKEPAACGGCGGKNLTQDPDTLDTWFSSALWPFSTLGWPQKTEDLEYFYPTDVLVTAYEIIFFWVVRMVFSGLYFMKELPFKDVLVTGMVLDSTGKKMSKSLGNGLDPIEVVDMFGADALRLMLVSGNALDNDTRFYMEKMEYSRNFLNKLWNASRFVLMNLGGEKICGAVSGVPADRWILSRLNTLVRDVTEKINAYELGMAAQYINDFIWDEFCDWYVEMVKPRLYDKDGSAEAAASRASALWTLRRALVWALKLLHPFTPFITETLF
ncbi:MAG: valine--tRNA ligase, partial [Defluviitaleaceae bacterium]|nr:valine--tRNA ligase [Defluviitaleaceae bacterium]